MADSANNEQTETLEIKVEPGSPVNAASRMVDEDCNGVIKEEDQDQPLDFSCRRRSESGSPRCSSPGSGQGSRHGDEEDMSNDENYRSRSNSSASDTDKIGEPKLAKPGTMPGTVFPGMIPGMLPNFASMPSGLSSLAGAASLLAGMSPSALASMLDQRKTNQSGGKSARPFKAYPKDPLALPLGYPYSLPTFIPSSTLASTNGGQTTVSDTINAHALHQSSDELFNIYRQQVLKAQEDIRKSKSGNPKNGETATSTTNLLEPQQCNSNSSSPTSSTTSTSNSRKRPRIYPDAAKDESYWDRRRKNNEAAKRSRDARRAKEDEIAIRAAFLEQENLKLRVEVAALKTETAKLRCMLAL